MPFVGVCAKTPRRNPKPPRTGAHHTPSKHKGRSRLPSSRKTLERSFFQVGVALCLLDLVLTADRSFASHLAVQTFDATRETRKAASRNGPSVKPSSAVNSGLSGPKRIAHSLRFARVSVQPANSRIAGRDHPRRRPRMRCNRRIGLETGARRMAGKACRDLGIIEMTGHHDGSFRALKDIAAGDSVTLDTGAYLNASPSTSPSLKLATWYPSLYFGRNIVRSVRQGTSGASWRVERRSAII